MYCKHCGARIDGDSRFCPNCGAPVGAGPGLRQQPARSVPYRQRAAEEPGRRAGSRRRSPVSAGFQGRLFGIPISGRTAIIILVILILVAVILNRRGG